MTNPVEKTIEISYHYTLEEFVEDKSLAEAGDLLGYSRSATYQMLQTDDSYLVKISGKGKNRKYEIIQIKNKGKK